MKPRILIVEDEEALATLLRYNLEKEGFEVETAGRGDDADTRLKEQVPDLAILGLDAARIFRHRAHAPIALQTRNGAIANSDIDRAQ